MMESADSRWEQRFSNYKRALSRLAEVVTGGKVADLSELEKEGLVQRFEYTYELAWKTLQDFLRFKGYVDIAGPTPVLMQALQDGYIADAAGWRAMKKSRELSSHTYDSDTAEVLTKAITSTYFALLDALAKRLESEVTGGQPSLF